MTPPWAVRFADRTPLTLVTMLRGAGLDPARRLCPRRARRRRRGDRRRSRAVLDRRRPRGPDAAAVRGSRARPLHDADGTEIGEEFSLGVRTCGTSLDGPNVLLTGSYQVRRPGLRAAAERAAARARRSRRGRPVPAHGPHRRGGRARRRRAAGRPRPAAGPAAADDPAGVVRPPGGRARRPGTARSATRSWAGRCGCCTTSRRARGPWRRWPTRPRVSRATLARRFTDLVGEPPMTYLTGWRLSLAADLLAAHRRHRRVHRPAGRLRERLRAERRLQACLRHPPERAALQRGGAEGRVGRHGEVLRDVPRCSPPGPAPPCRPGGHRPAGRPLRRHGRPGRRRRRRRR